MFIKIRKFIRSEINIVIKINNFRWENIGKQALK